MNQKIEHFGCSIQHLSEDDNWMFQDNLDIECDSTEFGYVFKIPKDYKNLKDEGCSDTLIKICDYATSNGYSSIQFDASGKVYDMFEIYNDDE